jgi:hypothetical protein
VVGEFDARPDNASIKLGLLSGSPFVHPSVMYRTADVLACGGYEQQMVPAEDYDLWWRLSARGRFGNITEPLLDYRVHTANAHVVQSSRMQQLSLAIPTRYLLEMGLVSSEQEAVLVLELHRKTRGDVSRHDTQRYCQVLERFLELLKTCDGATDAELNCARRQIRWSFMQQADNHRRSPGRMIRWLLLARQVDPVETTVGRLMSKTFERAWQHMTGRSA